MARWMMRNSGESSSGWSVVASRGRSRGACLTLNAGEVYFRKGGDTHGAKNVDDHRHHEVLVELKP